VPASCVRSISELPGGPNLRPALAVSDVLQIGPAGSPGLLFRPPGFGVAQPLRCRGGAPSSRRRGREAGSLVGTLLGGRATLGKSWDAPGQVLLLRPERLEIGTDSAEAIFCSGVRAP
jgi:hypothetical protein